MPIFGYILRESYFVNILFWHPATLYLFSLSIFSTAVCVFASPPPPTSLPVPFATTSHLLDLIEFFPEEEMFPPNESVEILHSDKHDPIFRLIKESLSLSSLPPSHLFVVADRPFLALPFFLSTIFDCTLNAFL